MTSGLDAALTVAKGDFRLTAELRVLAGQNTVVVGPNGSGKTTLARALAGLEAIDGGRVTLDDVVVDEPLTRTWVPPHQREASMLFQRGALFPNMTARQNVAFGIRHRSKRQRLALASDWLDRVGAGDCADQLPSTLSGGQAQRVALARALAPAPRLLILDEPLAAVDPPSRTVLRREIATHLRGHPAAQVLITHDPLDATDLADHILVLEGGRVAQQGRPAALRSQPATPYVAALVGVNAFTGTSEPGGVRLGDGALLVTARAIADGSVVTAVIHPRAVALHRRQPHGSPRNVWPARVAGLHLHDDQVRVEMTGSVPLVADVTRAAVGELGLAPGDNVWISVKATEIELHPR